MTATVARSITEILEDVERLRGPHDAALERIGELTRELQSLLDGCRQRWYAADGLRGQANAIGGLAAFDAEPFPATPPRVELRLGPRDRSMAEVWLR